MYKWQGAKSQNAENSHTVHKMEQREDFFPSNCKNKKRKHMSPIIVNDPRDKEVQQSQGQKIIHFLLCHLNAS